MGLRGLLPPGVLTLEQQVYIANLPALARSIAGAVVRKARDSGFGRFLPDDAVKAAVDAAMWNPTYDAYHPAPRSGLTPGE